MVRYRCLFIDAGDRFINVEEADLPDDRAADAWGADLLKQRSNFRATEVWHQGRFICRHDQAAAQGGPSMSIAGFGQAPEG